jgi:hypothetical protein
MRCAKHPQTETFITCSKCDTAVCIDCMVTGPVGIRCRKCAQVNSSPLFRPKPTGIIRAATAGILTAVFLGWVVMIPVIPFAFALGGAGLGCAVGEAVLRAGGRKRGKIMEYIAGGSAVIGALLWRIASIIPALLTIGPIVLLNPLWLFFTLICVGLAAVCAVSRIRYL